MANIEKYSKAELSAMNAAMIGRGAPVKRDNTGYNKPDYMVCQNYFDSLEDAQALDIAIRLQKYTNTQQIADKDRIKTTIDYYSSKTTNNNLDNCISISIGKTETIFAFAYNTDIISVVKTAQKRRFDYNTKNWFVDNKCTIDILKKLQNKGYKVDSALAIANEQLQNNTPVEATTPEKIKIKAVKKNDKIIISFPYNPDIVNAVKSLTNRKYDNMNKIWTIDKTEIKTLITKLQNIEDIDYSELEQYIVEVVEIDFNTIELKHLLNMTIKPFEHQLIAAKFLLYNKKAILADEMGGGKTKSSIIAMENIEGKKLIICPASLKYNWQKEIKQVNSEVTTFIVNGKGWIDEEVAKADYIIINYDIVKKNLENIQKFTFTTLTCDEAHYIKAVTNAGKAGSTRADAVLSIAKNIEYVFLLTGTPISNHTKDIFNLLKAIDSPLSRKFFSFAQRYCGAKHNGYGWDFNGSSNKKELFEKLEKHMIRRLKSELLELPEKIRTFIPVSVNLKAYNSMIDDYMNNRSSYTTKGEHLVKLNAMRKLLADQKSNNTIDLITDIIEQNKQVVVFSNYKSVVEKIESHFKENNIEIATIQGDDNKEKREKAVTEFQDGKVKIIVCNIIAGGVGITLTASDTVIFNDFSWLPSDHAQAEDRIHRIGQKNNCNIYYQYCQNAEIDEQMAELLNKKLLNINAVIDGKDESIFESILENL